MRLKLTLPDESCICIQREPYSMHEAESNTCRGNTSLQPLTIHLSALQPEPEDLTQWCESVMRRRSSAAMQIEVAEDQGTTTTQGWPMRLITIREKSNDASSWSLCINSFYQFFFYVGFAQVRLAGDAHDPENLNHLVTMLRNCTADLSAAPPASIAEIIGENWKPLPK